MTRQIMRTKIRLSLDNPPDQSSIGMAVNEKLAQQLLGNIDGRLFVE